jgi:hypothetical protein
MSAAKATYAFSAIPALKKVVAQTALPGIQERQRHPADDDVGVGTRSCAVRRSGLGHGAIMGHLAPGRRRQTRFSALD